MEDDGRYRDGRSDFIRGAKDIAKVAKKQVGKKVGRGVDKMADEYTRRSYKRFEEEDDDDDYAGVPGNDGGYYHNDSRANDEEGHSDSTEGHDEDDEIYEGEYQGIPRADSGKAPGLDGVTSAQAQQFRDLSAYEGERRKDQEELAQQYESILQECGHGKFQWTLYFVLGLALMADGVEIFVVGFVLPFAEKDMCLSEPNKGMLGKNPPPPHEQRWNSLVSAPQSFFSSRPSGFFNDSTVTQAKYLHFLKWIRNISSPSILPLCCSVIRGYSQSC